MFRSRSCGQVVSSVRQTFQHKYKCNICCLVKALQTLTYLHGVVHQTLVFEIGQNASWLCSQEPKKHLTIVHAFDYFWQCNFFVFKTHNVIYCNRTTPVFSNCAKPVSIIFDIVQMLVIDDANAIIPFLLLIL